MTEPVTQTVTQTARLEIVKPLDGDWDALGLMLRTLRRPLHRVMNGTITALEIAKAGGVGHETHPRTLAYQVTRDLWLADRAASSARMAKGKPWYGDEDAERYVPHSNVVLGVASSVYARWQKWQKEKWRGTMTLPTFGNDGPIYMVGASVQLRAEDGNTVLSLGLLGGRAEWARILVKPYGPAGYADIARMLADPTCVGDCRLVEKKRDGKPKWTAMVSYSHEVKTHEPGATMAIHRGVRNFLTVAIGRHGTKEAWTSILETGDDIRRHKDAYQARRRSLSSQSRQLGAGAKGHGKARRGEHVDRLMNSESRWVESKCREVAAHALKIAERRGVSRILVEDWGNPAADGAPEMGEFVEKMVRQFPMAQLRTCIEWGAKKRGLAVELVGGDFNSRTCPACSHVNAAHAGDTFRCEQCYLERPRDVIFVWNMLGRDGKPGAHEDAKAASKRAAKRLEKAAKAA